MAYSSPFGTQATTLQTLDGLVVLLAELLEELDFLEMHLDGGILPFDVALEPVDFLLAMVDLLVVLEHVVNHPRRQNFCTWAHVFVLSDVGFVHFHVGGSFRLVC